MPEPYELILSVDEYYGADTVKQVERTYVGAERFDGDEDQIECYQLDSTYNTWNQEREYTKWVSDKTIDIEIGMWVVVTGWDMNKFTLMSNTDFWDTYDEVDYMESPYWT